MVFSPVGRVVYLLGLFVMASSVVSSSVVLAQDYDVSLSPSTIDANVGGTLELSVVAKNAAPITGFSLGVRHDAAALDIVEVALGEAATAANDAPDARFFEINTDPSGGPGFTAALVLSVDDPGVSIPVGEGQELLKVRYRVMASEAGMTTVSLAQDLGAPQVRVVLDTMNGDAQRIVDLSGDGQATVSFTVSTEGAFLRGDVSQSGRLDILDATVILRYAFFEEVSPISENCLVAFNADGSTRSDVVGQEDPRDIGLLDGLLVLNTLFAGDSPPAPFPSCGPSPNPLAERMACGEFNCR